MLALAALAELHQSVLAALEEPHHPEASVVQLLLEQFLAAKLAVAAFL